MKKRLVSLMLCAVMGITMLAGCASGSGDSGEEKGSSGSDETIVVWMKKDLTDVANDMFKERCEQFAEENDVNVEVEVIAYEDFYTKWAAAIESGNLPDLSYFGYQEMGQYYNQGILEDLTDVYNEINDMNPFEETLASAVTSSDGIVYGIPGWASVQVLYYRTDMFEAAGLEAPETWDDFREAAIALTDEANGIYGAGIGYGASNSDAEWLTRAMLWSNGSVDVDEAGKVAIDSEETIATAQYIQNLFLTDKVTPPTAVNWDDSGNNKAYLSGQCAMIFNVGSLLNTIQTDDPDLYENTGIAIMPSGSAGAMVPGILDGYGIFKDASNKDGAKELVKYLMEKEWYTEWVNETAPFKIPVLQGMKEDSVWQEERNKPFIDSVENFTFLGYPNAYTPAASEVFNSRLLSNCFTNIVSGSDVSEEIASLQTQMQEAYDKE